MVKSKHLIIAEDISKSLLKSFPNSSFAISGSVANNTHNMSSDLDLLLVNRAFQKNRQLVFNYENIEVNILCLNPELIKKRLENNLIHFDMQHLGYIKNCKIICDIDNHIKELQLVIENIIIQRHSTPSVSLEKLDRILSDQLIKKENEESLSIDNSKVLYFLRIMISYWLIKNKKIILCKNDISKIFSELKLTNHIIYKTFKDFWHLKANKHNALLTIYLMLKEE